jgi:hypothetical protein
MKTIPDDMPREVVQEGLPAGSERRLVLRLLKYWRGLQDGDWFPPFSAIDNVEIADMWNDSFVLDLAGHENDPVFRWFGNGIACRCGGSLIGRHVSEVPENCLASVVVTYLDDVLAREAPMSRGGELVLWNGVRILYRSILMPLSDDGKTITGILGGANCREVTEE